MENPLSKCPCLICGTKDAFGAKLRQISMSTSINKCRSLNQSLNLRTSDSLILACTHFELDADYLEHIAIPGLLDAQELPSIVPFSFFVCTRIYCFN